MKKKYIMIEKFDVLSKEHIYSIKWMIGRAGEYCVYVMSDEFVYREFGRYPIWDENKRMEMLIKQLGDGSFVRKVETNEEIFTAIKDTDKVVIFSIGSRVFKNKIKNLAKKMGKQYNTEPK